jgi:DNA-binding MarR family transcriptional regulator
MKYTSEDVGLLIKRAQHRHHRELDASLATMGISLVQWSALREIDRNPDASMHRLAELSFNSDQAFGTLTTRLLRSGLIERFQGAGRVTHHRLTPKGAEFLRKGRKLVTKVLASSFASLDEDERDTLGRLLAKLLA